MMDLSYLGGYADADGCVQFTNGCPRISVVSTYPGVVKEFHALFGGSVSIEEGAGRRRVWRWQATGDKAIDAMMKLRPHMQEKVAQIDIIFRLRESKPGPLRDALIAQMKALKQHEYPIPKGEQE